MGEKVDKAALKELREVRKATVEGARKRVKTQTARMKAIKEALKGGGGKTIPELADALRLPAAEVLWYITAMRKYGGVVEGDKDGDYFRYELSETG